MSDIPRCKTCKHWERFHGNPDLANKGSCELITHEKSKLAWADEYGYFTTHEDFGCVEHEEKP